MKKFTKFLSLFFVAGVAFMLAACGKTDAPATQAPATQAPATQAPATQAPATQAPATQAPATQAPGTTTVPECDIHTYDGEWVNTDEAGHYKVCSVCGNQSEMEDHEYTSTITTPATPTTKGVKTYTCSVCGYSYTEETDLAYVWEVADGAYLTDYTSKTGATDTHFRLSYSEDRKTITVESDETVGWASLQCYASGATDGYGIHVKISAPETATSKAAFIIKVNDIDNRPSEYYIYRYVAEAGQSKDYYIAGSDLPENMTHMVIMVNANNTAKVGSISMNWVKLDYAETPTYTFDAASGKLVPTYACTTEGFTKYSKTGEGIAVEQSSVKAAMNATAGSKVPVLMSGFVTEINPDDARGVVSLVFKDADGEYLVSTAEMSKFGTLFSYAVNESGAVEATYTHADNFKELGLVEGDFVNLIGIVSKYNDGTIHFYSEMISKGDATDNLSNQAFTTVPTIPAGMTADKDSYKFGEDVVVTFTKTADQVVKECYVQRAAGQKVYLTASADNKVTFKAGVHDTLVLTVGDYKYETTYTVTPDDVPGSYSSTVAAFPGKTIPLAGIQVMKSASIQLKSKAGMFGNTASVGVINTLSATRPEGHTNLQYARRLSVYAANAPITDPTAEGVVLVGEFNWAENDYAEKTINVMEKGVFQYFLVMAPKSGDNTGATNLATFTVDTSVPTGANYVDIMAITTDPTSAGGNVRGYQRTTSTGAWISKSTKNNWVLGPNFANPVKGTNKVPVAFVLVISARNYTSENGAYIGLRFCDHSANSLTPKDFNMNVTEDFKVFTLSLDRDNFTSGYDSFLASDLWKFCALNGCGTDEAPNVEFYTWQAYVILADAENAGGSSENAGGSSENAGGSSENAGGSSENAGGSSENAGGSSENAGGSSENAGGSSENANDSSENAGGSSENAGGSSENAGGSSENAGGSSENAGGSSENAGGSSENAGGSSENAGGSSENAGGSSENANDSSENANDGAERP